MFAKRPLLIGGLGLSATLWLMDVVHFNMFDGSTLLGAIALGSGIWWWQRHKPRPAAALQVSPPPVQREAVEQAIDRVGTLIDQLQAEIAETCPPQTQMEWKSSLDAVRQRHTTLQEGLDRSQLQLGIAGAAGAGKSALMNELLRLDLPCPYQLQELGSSQASQAIDARAIDAILWLTPGDLTNSDREAILGHLMAGQAVTLVFSQQDHYLPADRETVMQQLQRRAAELPAAVEVVAIAAAPKSTRVRRHGSNGQIEEWLEPTPADLGQLPEHLGRLATTQAPALMLATTQRQVDDWRRQVQQALNQVRRQRALPIVEQLQWTAAASAFAIPVASLDLLAAAAINAQLLMDLGKIYGLSWSWQEAKALAQNLAELTVKLGLVEISTQALALALKGHPATYAVGGTLQGLSAAYLTRMVGLSLIETLEAAALDDQGTPALSLERLGQRLRELLLENRQGQFLQGLIEQGMQRLRPADLAESPMASRA